MATSEDAYEVVIEPAKGLLHLDLDELWRYRELFYIFAWRDLKVRYKQTAIGAAWAILQPLVMMIVFTVIFGNLAGIDSDGIPYPIFVYTGLLIWQYFSSSLDKASNSLIAHQAMVQKIYFPRIILPIASTLSGLVDLAIASSILVALMVYYRFTPTPVGILLLPVFVMITTLAALGLGFFLSAINVKFRDIRYALPFFIQIMLYVTPVIYPVSLTGGKWRALIWLNPMSGVIRNMRAGMLGVTGMDWTLLLASGVLSAVLFMVGLVYFRANEKEFADII